MPCPTSATILRARPGSKMHPFDNLTAATLSKTEGRVLYGRGCEFGRPANHLDSPPKRILFGQSPSCFDNYARKGRGSGNERKKCKRSYQERDERLQRLKERLLQFTGQSFPIISFNAPSAKVLSRDSGNGHNNIFSEDLDTNYTSEENNLYLKKKDNQILQSFLMRTFPIEIINI